MDLTPYLIPDDSIATESDSTMQSLAGTLIFGSLLIAIGCKYNDWKKAKEDKAKQKAMADKQKSIAAAKAAWFDSPEGQACKQRLQRKYGQDINVDSKKLAKAIQTDIIKIAKQLNSNKKTCAKWAEEWITHAKRLWEDLTPDELKDIEDTANEIRTAPCSTTGEDIDDFVWVICDLEQMARIWICDKYLFELFCNALDTKYSD
ncbi:MAG: hypothetical protein NC548_05340 [Lachnospiraceae bacterium]|nr:hypothetical protein [Lachnospiraceae bacterium]